MAGASFQLSLTDKVTGPASKAEGSLKSVLGVLAGGAGAGGKLEGATAQLGTAFDRAGGASAFFSNRLDPLAIAAKGAQLGIDLLTGKIDPMTAAVEAAKLALMLAIDVVIAFGQALVAAAGAAITFSQEKDAMVATLDALGSTAGKGEAVLEMIENLGKELPFTVDQMGKWAKSMMAAGIQGPALEKAIRAVAASTALMGEEGGHAAETLIKKLAEVEAVGGKIKLDAKMLKQMAAAGVSAEALAKALGTTPDKLSKMNLTAAQMGKAFQDALIGKGKGALDNFGLTWESIKSKFMDGIGDIFEDLGPAVQPFMQAVKELFGEFGKGGSAATSWKSIVTGALTSLFAFGTKVVKVVHTLMNVVTAIGGWQRLWNIMKGVAIAAALLLAPFVILGAAIAAAVFVAIYPFVLIAEAIGDLVGAADSALGAISSWASGSGAAISDFVSKAAAAIVEWVLSAPQAASDYVMGLVDQISAGAGLVANAVRKLAASAVGAIKDALGISSPSKVLAKIGGHTTAGFVGAIEDGQASVEAASAGLGHAAATGADGVSGAAGKAGAAAKPGAAGLVINGLEIHVTCASGDALELTEAAVVALFERIAMSQGLVTT